MPSPLAKIFENVRFYVSPNFLRGRSGKRTKPETKFLPPSKSFNKLEALKMLCEEASSSGIKLLYLTQNSKKSDINDLIYKDLNKLLESGCFSQALLFLDLSMKVGFRSNRLDMYRARALMSVERYSDAMKIWKDFDKCEDAAIKQKASSQSTKILNLFLKDASSTLKSRKWNIQYLPNKVKEGLPELESLIVQEASVLRKAGQLEISLKLLEKALSFGLRNPEMDDHRAKALVKLNRNREALKLWKINLNSDLPKDLHAKFTLHINRIEEKVDRQKVDQLILKLDHSEACYLEIVDILVDLILLYPNTKFFQKRLAELAATHSASQSIQPPCVDELKAHNERLAYGDAFLSALEKRYKIT